MKGFSKSKDAASSTFQASGPEDAYRRIANGALRMSCLRNSGALAIESEELLRSLLVSWPG